MAGVSTKEAHWWWSPEDTNPLNRKGCRVRSPCWFARKAQADPGTERPATPAIRDWEYGWRLCSGQLWSEDVEDEERIQ